MKEYIIEDIMDYYTTVFRSPRKTIYQTSWVPQSSKIFGVKYYNIISVHQTIRSQEGVFP